jgi:hypothetical protein
MVEVILLLIQCERLPKFSNLRVHAVAELRQSNISQSQTAVLRMNVDRFGG